MIIGFEDKKQFIKDVKQDSAYCEKNDCCVDGRQSLKDALEKKTGLELDFCYNHPHMSVIATMMYMVVANIIMLNILIAMFNFRYELVQAMSVKISAHIRCSL